MGVVSLSAHVIETVCVDAEAAQIACAGAMVDALATALDRRPRVSFAGSGGTTPKAVYPIMAKADLPWARVVVTLTDERWVPVDDPQSNEGLARRHLLVGAAAAAEMIGLKNDAATPSDGLIAAERALAPLPWPLDVVYLGMGPDGHIASLFPSADTWGNDAARLVSAHSPAAPHERMSLSMASLIAAREVFLLVTGDAKRTVLEGLDSGPEDAALPIAGLINQRSRGLRIYRD